MTLPVFAIRPEPGLASTAAEGRALGLEMIGEPLFEIAGVDWTAPDPASVDALLIGSANALRHGGAQIARFLGKPVHAVGQATAQAAAAAGFAVEIVGNGGLQAVLDRKNIQPLRYLRLTGAERVALTLPVGVTVAERVVYSVHGLPMSQSMKNALYSGGIILLHSAAAARHFREECDRLGIDRKRLILAALGPRILAAAGGGWAQMRHSSMPEQTALLALAKELCQGN